MFIKKGFSRRGFVKLGLSGLTGLAVKGNSWGKIRENYKNKALVSRTSSKQLIAIPTTCKQCPAGCGVVAYLDNDRLVQIQGNPDHPNNRGGICGKGIAAINLVNDVERMLYPMKRVGPRGSSRWSRITWDEAYSMIQSIFGDALTRNRMKGVVMDTGVSDPLLNLFARSLGISNWIQRPQEKNRSCAAAWQSMTGLPGFIVDAENSRTIFNFGANPFGNHDHFIGIAQRLISARIDGGAHLITFDVRMSETAAKSDSWFPIKAGTDGLLALSLARVILEKGWQNQSLFRDKSPAFRSSLKDHLSRFTTRMAASECGIPAERIEQLAFRFAHRKPSVAIMGGGTCDHVNGYENARCITLLNLVAGNVGEKGGLLFPEPLEKVDLPSGYVRQNTIMKRPEPDLRTFLESGEKVDAFFACLSNPAYSEPEARVIQKFLKDESKIPFVMVMDTHMTETAILSDLVLPAATFLESWGLEAGISLENKFLINFIQPAVSVLSDAEVLRSPFFDVGKLLDPQFRPRGESKEIGNVCIELARRLGDNVSRNFPFLDTQDFVKKRIAGFPRISEKGGIAFLRQQGFSEEPLDELNRQGFLDSFGQKQALEKDNSFPEYQPIGFSQRRKATDFILTGFKPNLYAYGTANSKWAQEFFHDNRLWINTRSARRLGFKNGEKVRVVSAAGSLIVRILVTGRIHPDSVAVAEGLGHSAMGQVARGIGFRSTDADTRLIWWGEPGNGVNPNIVMERKAGSDGISFGTKDTVVRIEKV